MLTCSAFSILDHSCSSPPINVMLERFEQREFHAHRANIICCNVLKRLGFYGSHVRVNTILDKQGGVTMQVVAEQQAMRMPRRHLQQASLLIPQRAQAHMHFLRWVPYRHQDIIFRLALATFQWEGAPPCTAAGAV